MLISEDFLRRFAKRKFVNGQFNFNTGDLWGYQSLLELLQSCREQLLLVTDGSREWCVIHIEALLRTSLVLRPFCLHARRGKMLWGTMLLLFPFLSNIHIYHIYLFPFLSKIHIYHIHLSPFLSNMQYSLLFMKVRNYQWANPENFRML